MKINQVKLVQVEESKRCNFPLEIFKYAKFIEQVKLYKRGVIYFVLLLVDGKLVYGQHNLSKPFNLKKYNLII